MPSWYTLAATSLTQQVMHEKTTRNLLADQSIAAVKESQTTVVLTPRDHVCMYVVRRTVGFFIS
jgi:hypothetical protein